MAQHIICGKITTAFRYRFDSMWCLYREKWFACIKMRFLTVGSFFDIKGQGVNLYNETLNNLIRCSIRGFNYNVGTFPDKYKTEKNYGIFFFNEMPLY